MPPSLSERERKGQNKSPKRGVALAYSTTSERNSLVPRAEKKRRPQADKGRGERRSSADRRRRCSFPKKKESGRREKKRVGYVLGLAPILS